MIAGFVTDATLATKYKVTREEYVSTPPNVRRKFRAYLQRKHSRGLTLKQFQLMVTRRSGP